MTIHLRLSAWLASQPLLLGQSLHCCPLPQCSRPGCATCRPCIKEIDGSNCQAGQWCTLCKQVGRMSHVSSGLGVAADAAPGRAEPSLAHARCQHPAPLLPPVLPPLLQDWYINTDVGGTCKNVRRTPLAPAPALRTPGRTCIAQMLGVPLCPAALHLN